MNEDKVLKFKIPEDKQEKEVNMTTEEKIHALQSTMAMMGLAMLEMCDAMQEVLIKTKD